MKCEKHNSEMKWVGSLTQGSMHCEICRFEAADRDSIVPSDYNRDSGAEAVRNLPYAQAPVPGTTPPPAPNAPTINWAKVRVGLVDKMIQGVYATTTKAFNCIYCGQHVDISNIATHYYNGTQCFDEYMKDNKDQYL